LLIEDREYEIFPLGKTGKYFERIINSEILQKICTIRIRGINKLSNYISDYKLIFDKLNKNNVNYCSIKFYLNKDSDIDFFNELFIDINKIKRLTLSKFEKIDNFSNIYSKLFLKNLKEVDLQLEKIDEKAIFQVQGNNYSLKKMKLVIYQDNNNSNNLVNSLIKKFPDLENILLI